MNVIHRFILNVNAVFSRDNRVIHISTLIITKITNLYLFIYIFCAAALPPHFNNYSEGSYTHENNMF